MTIDLRMTIYEAIKMLGKTGAGQLVGLRGRHLWGFVSQPT